MADVKDTKTETKDETTAPVLEEKVVDVIEPIESAPPLWDKDRQREDQEKANATKAQATNNDGVKELLEQIIGAKAQQESLIKSQEARHQKQSELDSLADLDPNEFVDDPKKLKSIFMAMAKRIEESSKMVPEKDQTTAALASRLAVLEEQDKVKLAEASKAADQDSFNKWWDAKASSLGGERMAAAWAEVSAVRKAEGSGFAGAINAIHAMSEKLTDIMVQEAQGTRPKPAIKLDGGSGGTKPITGKTGSFKDLMAEARSEGKVG